MANVTENVRAQTFVRFVSFLFNEFLRYQVDVRDGHVWFGDETIQKAERLLVSADTLTSLCTLSLVMNVNHHYIPTNSVMIVTPPGSSIVFGIIYLAIVINSS